MTHRSPYPLEPPPLREQPMTHCPDCGAKCRIQYAEPRCPFKSGPGYGPCGEPRPRMSVVEAARALVTVMHGDRDGNHVQFSNRDPLGRQQREWWDLLDALDRAEANR